MINFAGSGGAAGGAFEGDMARESKRIERARLAAQIAANNADRAQKERQMNMDNELSASKLLMEGDHALTAEDQAQQKLNLQAEDQAWGRIVEQQRMRESERRMRDSEVRAKQGEAEFERYNMLFQQEKEEKAKQKWLAQTGISSAMKLAAMNGGVVPESCIASLNHDFGIEGKDGNGFIGGGFQKDGTFVLDFKKIGADGNDVIVPQALTPIQQMRAIQQTGIYDENHMNNLYKTLMRSGMRPDEIMLDSKTYQTGQSHGQVRRGAGTAQSELKDHLSALSAIKGFIDSNEGKLDEETLNGLKAAYSNGIMGIASQYAPRQPDSGATNVPRVNEDGTLVFPNGKTLRKNQEYTNPRDGKKYIWRGGDIRNFEAI